MGILPPRTYLLVFLRLAPQVELLLLELPCHGEQITCKLRNTAHQVQSTYEHCSAFKTRCAMVVHKRVPGLAARPVSQSCPPVWLIPAPRRAVCCCCAHSRPIWQHQVYTAQHFCDLSTTGRHGTVDHR